VTPGLTKVARANLARLTLAGINAQSVRSSAQADMFSISGERQETLECEYID